MRIRLVDLAGDFEVAAWIPAQALTRRSWTGAEPDPDITRVELPKEDQSWPGPQRWPFWHTGVRVSSQLLLPPGAVMMTGAGWRNRPARDPR